MDDIYRYLFADILPIIVSVGVVGFKVYHDLKHLKLQVVDGFKSISKQMHTMNDNISELQIQIVENKTADQYRDKALERLDIEIHRLNDKINNR